jgi:hypothetical protein
MMVGIALLLMARACCAQGSVDAGEPFGPLP